MRAAGTAEEHWPDVAGYGYRDTVTEFEMPPGTFFDIAVAHLLTTATINRLRALYPDSRFEVRRLRPNIAISPGGDDPGLRKRLDWPRGRDRRHHPPGDHRTLSPLRDDHTAAG
jgi:hypothetical protein